MHIAKIKVIMTVVMVVGLACGATGFGILGGLTAAGQPEPAKEGTPKPDAPKQAETKFEGTQWQVEYTGTPGYIETWSFAADGKLSVESVAKDAKPGSPGAIPVRSPDSFDWLTDRGALAVTLNSKAYGRNFTRFVGTIEGDGVRGKVRNELGFESEWVMTRVKTK